MNVTTDENRPELSTRYFRIKTFGGYCMRRVLQVFFILIVGLTVSWGQTLSNCTVSYGLGPFSSAQAALDAVNADQGTPDTETSELMICRGRAVHMEYVLGPPTEFQGRTTMQIQRDITQARCTAGRIESTSRAIYDIGSHVACDSFKPLHLYFTGPTKTRPAGTGGTSEITITAKVTQSSNPKSGVALIFSVDVTANSGGHEHHDASRPKGKLSATKGTTDANGEVNLTFTAQEIAGIHTVKATCPTCSNTVVTKEVQVKVAELLPISPNPPQFPDGTFAYALTSVDRTHQGDGRYHHQQYYLTEQSQANLQSMIEAFDAEGWGTVALNDASLYWGGRYDINANWAGSHKGHREGREIDISFTRAKNPISKSKQKVVYDKFCKSKKASFPFSILHHYVKSPHFHVYLEKQTACWKSEK